MSTFLWIELVCDGCSTTGPGQFTAGSAIGRIRKALKAEVKDAGWQFISNNVYCPSPKCKKEAEEYRQLRRRKPL